MHLVFSVQVDAAARMLQFLLSQIYTAAVCQSNVKFASPTLIYLILPEGQTHGTALLSKIVFAANAVL